jgi:carboxyl-terminal processing protease
MRTAQPLAFSLILTLAGATLTPALHAQEPAPKAQSGAIDELVARAAKGFAAADVTGAGDAWRLAYDIAAQGPQVVPALKRHAAGDDAGRSLVALRALAELGEGELAVRRALEWADKGEGAMRVHAAELVAVLAGRAKGDRWAAARGLLQETLPTQLDETFEPRVKVPLSVALWHALRDRRAVRECKALLASEDPEVAVAAALGLGEMGDIQAARRMLSRLRDEPTARGRLAAAILEKGTLERLAGVAGAGGNKEPRITGTGLALLEELREVIRNFYPDEHKSEELIRAAARGIAAALDPATELLEDGGHTPAGEAGIGLRVALHGGLPTVIGLVPGGVADRLGLRNGDRILSVDGDTVFDESLPEVAAKLRGEAGSEVTIQFFRDQEPRWVRWHKHTIARTAPATPKIEAWLLPGGIAYLRMPGLTTAGAAEVRAALAEIKASEAKGVIIDLRSLAAGPREALMAVAAEFIGGGALVYSSKGRNAKMAPPTEHRTSGDGAKPAFANLTVLVGRGTSGPGELLAAALRHHHGATLVGAKTFGNGQEVYTFPLAASRGRSYLRLPVAAYTTADGTAYHGKGLEPAVEASQSHSAGWIETERDKVRAAGQHAREAQRLLQEMEPEAVAKLAVSDGGDWHAYPGYSEWYGGLGTRAEPEHLRPLLRRALRAALAADGRGPAVDPREDLVLQAAVLRIAGAAGIETSAIPLYAGLTAK